MDFCARILRLRIILQVLSHWYPSQIIFDSRFPPGWPWGVTFAHKDVMFVPDGLVTGSERFMSSVVLNVVRRSLRGERCFLFAFVKWRSVLLFNRGPRCFESCPIQNSTNTHSLLEPPSSNRHRDPCWTVAFRCVRLHRITIDVGDRSWLGYGSHLMCWRPRRTTSGARVSENRRGFRQSGDRHRTKFARAVPNSYVVGGHLEAGPASRWVFDDCCQWIE